ncbi:MAG TPA: hypothetical protein VFN09_00870, partial [Rhodanobacteraceae bacterium]|nr:hypothetical protein [Rhodanobacteraceae bacterium]
CQRDRRDDTGKVTAWDMTNTSKAKKWAVRVRPMVNRHHAGNARATATYQVAFTRIECKPVPRPGQRGGKRYNVWLPCADFPLRAHRDTRRQDHAEEL